MSAVWWWVIGVVGVAIAGIAVLAIRSIQLEKKWPYPWAHETHYDKSGKVILDRWVEMPLPEEYVAEGVEGLARFVQKLVEFQGWHASIIAFTVDRKRGVSFSKQAGKVTYRSNFDIRKDTEREQVTRELLAARGYKIEREYVAMDRRRMISWFLPNQLGEIMALARDISGGVGKIGVDDSLCVTYQEHAERNVVEGSYRIKIRMPSRQRCQVPKVKGDRQL
jgi:hypothetical protein